MVWGFIFVTILAICVVAGVLIFLRNRDRQILLASALYEQTRDLLHVSHSMFYCGDELVSEYRISCAVSSEEAFLEFEPDAASMLEEIERALYLQSESDVKFEGIQFDVEPYCLDDFDENADAYFAQYVENCKTAYAAAHAAGLKVELCIPYWYDSSYGYNDQLEDLIANACDSIAVMNYYKNDKEIKHIASELELCRKYDKPIVNITEMQEPGTHGLTENNTYYHDGMEAVEEMWSEMEAYFGYEKLGYSYHYLNTMVELLGL